MQAVHRLKVIGAPDVLLSCAVVLLIAAPLLVTSKALGEDASLHMWLGWIAGKSLVGAGHPTYFTNTTTEGVFSPWFAFEGGTLYMATGAVSELLGGRPYAAYVGVSLLAITAAYAGTLWLGRQFGLRGLVAHAPAAAVVTSAYYITELYGRGVWNEFIAISAIAPLAASAVYLTRAPRWRPWPVLVFVVSAVVFTGSHNLTLLWGTTVALVALLVLWLVMGRPRDLPYRRLAMVAALGVTSALVNSWYLLTDITHSHDTGIYHARYTGQELANRTSYYDTPGNLFNPLRHVASVQAPALYMQAPVWFLVWGLLAGSLLLRGGSSRLRRVWIGATILVTLLLAAIMLKPFWEHLPNPWAQAQFPYRLNAYVLYVVAALVLVGALAVERASTDGPKRPATFLRFALPAVTAISLGLCVWQQWHSAALPATNRSAAFTSAYVDPRGVFASFADRRAPVVSTPPGRKLTIPPSQVKGDHFAAVMNVPPGPQPIQTNIDGGDYLVRISGLEWLGRNRSGYAVVRRPNGGSDPVRVTIGTAPSRAITLGRALSLVALIAVFVVLVGTSLPASARVELSDLAARLRRRTAGRQTS